MTLTGTKSLEIAGHRLTEVAFQKKINGCPMTASQQKRPLLSQLLVPVVEHGD